MTHRSPCSTQSSAWSTAWIKGHLDRMDRVERGNDLGNRDADTAQPSQIEDSPPTPLRPDLVERMKGVARRHLWLAG
ncbi:hypothetical protein [Rhodococcus jostii]|uniref:Uncharacterized protein n=1 Tax=Rhodococcus jostii TaxID=132919 RepID=A0A1H5D0W7_RHOJO|nr:hypothetical protein [Rhodococcus jostii]SED72599.1 hypothetical protein SAMN04490220_5340 [Rhodococcus jostii]